MARNTAVKALPVIAITAIMLIAAWHLGMKKKFAGPPMIVANCISNIRSGGLAPADAAVKLHYLLERSRRLRLSGVALKDDGHTLADGPPRQNLAGECAESV